MSFASTTSHLRRQSLSNQKTKLTDQKKYKCLSCLSFFYFRGAIGSSRAILYNTMCLLITFVFLYDAFPLESRHNTKRMLRQALPMEEFHSIVDFNTYFHWQDTFVTSALTFVTNYNKQDYNDVRHSRTQSESIVWNSILITQDRIPNHAVCEKLSKMTNPAAIDMLSNTLLLQGLDCDDNSSASFGKYFNGTAFLSCASDISSTNSAVLHRPMFPQEHSASLGLNPFQPFESGSAGFQTTVHPDPRAGLYVFVATSPTAVANTFKLKQCHWLDLKTRQVKVSTMFWNIGTQEIGLVEHVVTFDALGRATPRLTIDMARFEDTNHASCDFDCVSFQILACAIGHKGFLAITSLLWPLVRKVVFTTSSSDDGNSASTSTTAPRTCTSTCVGFMHALCEVYILFVAVMFWMSGFNSIESSEVRTIPPLSCLPCLFNSITL